MKYSHRFPLWMMSILGLAAAASSAHAAPRNRDADDGPAHLRPVENRNPKAQLSPQLYTSPYGKETARFYTDGEHAVGGALGQLPAGQMSMTLLGRAGGRSPEYQGTLTGTFQQGSRALAMTGSWSFDADQRNRVIVVHIRVKGRDPQDVRLDLGDPAAPPRLRCGWATGHVTQAHGGQPHPLTTGDPIAVGDTVVTGPGSAAILVLDDRSVAVMQEGTTLSLPSGSFNSGPIDRVQLRGGKIWFAVRKLGAGQKFEVETGQAVAAVRGTEFVVEDGPAGTAVTMADGTVQMSGAGVPNVAVTAGQMWTPAGVARIRLLDLYDEWNELLAIADACWPFRAEERIPFWEDDVKNQLQRAGNQKDPLDLAPLLVAVAQIPVGQPVVNGGNNNGGNDNNGGNGGNGGGNGGGGGRRRGNGVGRGVGIGLGVIGGLGGFGGFGGGGGRGKKKGGW